MRDVHIDFSGASAVRTPSRFVVRVEREEDDFIVSPLLGGAQLCETCWILRRIATMNLAALCPQATRSEDLVLAFHDRVARGGRPVRPAQRAGIARVLRQRGAEARHPGPPEGLPTLVQVGPTGESVSERVLPLPGCNSCQLASTDGSEPDSLSAVVGKSAGIVAEWMALPPLEEEPSYPHVVVTRLANSQFEPTRRFWAGGSGKGDSAESAYGSAIGESLELYAAGTLSTPLRVARAADLDGPFIEPRRLSGMSDEQARAAGYNPDGKLAWVRATPLDASAGPVWVPASAVYLRLPERLRHEVGTPFSSNGLACARTLEEALDEAHAEVLERHLFFSAWYGLGAPESTPAHQVTHEMAGRLEFADSGLEVRFSVLGILSGIVVASSSCWPREPSPARPNFVLGLGTGTDAAAAMRRAMREMAQVYRGLSWALRDPSLRARAEELRRDVMRIEDPYDHALYFACRSPDTVPSPFGSGPPRCVASTGVVDRVLDPDGAVFVDLTPRDVAHSARMRVTRVVVPDLIPFHYGAARIPFAMLPATLSERPASEWIHPLS